MNIKTLNFKLRALDLFEDDRIDKALEMIDIALASSQCLEDRVDVLFEKALMLDQIEDNVGALECYKDILELENSPQAMYGLAMIYEKIHEYDLAEDYYLQCIEVDPNYDRAYFFLANLYDVSGLYDKAIEYYQKAITLCPDDNMIYNNLGAIYENIYQYDKALEYLDKAIELDKNYFRPYFNKGVVYGKLDNEEKAIENYLTAIERNPSYSYTYLNMSALYIEKDKLIESLKILNLGVKNADDKADLYYNRACIKMYLNNSQMAMEDLKVACNLDVNLGAYAKDDVDFSSLREDERFLEIIGDRNDIFEK